jgi:hypothetical protein
MPMNRSFFSITIRVQALLLLICAGSSAPSGVYFAELLPIGGVAATGSVAVFLHAHDGFSYVGFTGMVHDVEPSLTDSLCAAPNGCGAHIHAGKSCDSMASQVRNEDLRSNGARSACFC